MLTVHASNAIRSPMVSGADICGSCFRKCLGLAEDDHLIQALAPQGRPSAGQRPMAASANAVLSEIHRTWNRPEAAELAKLYALVTMPP